MSDDIRHSKAHEAELISDPDDLARQESLNTVRQFAAVSDMVETFVSPERQPFRFRPSHLLHLHRAALDGISSYAGNYRPASIEIGGSKHQPPPAHMVPEYIEELCDYINDKWKEKSPIHLSSYVMWKLNWIHAFTDGNGRTSRAAAYLILCTKLGYVLPGHRTIPDQIAENKTPYYKALEAADEAWSGKKVDLTAMKHLLSSMLAEQLKAVHDESSAGEDE